MERYVGKHHKEPGHLTRDNTSPLDNVRSPELASLVDTIIARLREDDELAALLGDVRRAGRVEHYQALAFRLGLQDWFCAYCGQFMVQSELGVKRRTCSDRCRNRLHRAPQSAWENQLKRPSSESTQTTRKLVSPVSDEKARDEKLIALIQPIEAGERHYHWWHSGNTFWWQPETKSRDLALMLLGFTCPIPLSPSDLATLDVDDVLRVRGGLEGRLYRRDDRRKRYITIPSHANPRLCTATAVSAWQERLRRARHTTGPLFIRMDPSGHLPLDDAGYLTPKTATRLNGYAVTRVIGNAAKSSYWSLYNRFWYGGPNSSEPLPIFLDKILNEQHE